MRIRTLVTRRSITAVLTGLLLLVVIVGGLVQLRIDTDVDSFLPSGDPTVGALHEQARSFGGDPIVVVLESRQEHKLLLDRQQFPRLLKLEGQLAKLPDVATVYGPATGVNQIAASAQNLLAQISGKRDALRARAEAVARSKDMPRDEVQAAGEAAVKAFDDRYGALFVKALPAGLPTTYNPQFIESVIYGEQGKPQLQWQSVVPSADSVAILVRPREGLDQAGTERLVDAVRATTTKANLATSRLTVSGIPVITSGLTSKVTEELPLLGGLVVLVMLVRFVLIPTTTGWVRRLWPLAAAALGTSLALSVFGWLGIGVSLGAVALFPLVLGVGSSFPLYLATLADRRIVVTAALATAGGFGSLAVSPLPFVRELGVGLALGVILTLAGSLTVSRSLLDKPVEPAIPATTPAPRSRRWAVLMPLVVIAILGWSALPVVQVQANPEALARGIPELEQARHAEKVLGSSGEIKVVLRGNDVLSPQALDWARSAEEAIIANYGDQVRPVLTMPDLLQFLGTDPSPEEVASGVNLLPPYLTSAVIRPDHRQAVMIFGLQLQDLEQQSRLLDRLRSVLPPPPNGFQADLVGLPVAADRGYTLVSEGRYFANVTGIVVAGAILTLGLRRRRDVIGAMLAAVMATGWALAGVWLLGVQLSPLTILLGSLTAVTASEFAVLLREASRGRGTGLRRIVALACVTSAAGYLTLLASELWLLREFSIVLAATVLLSYVAARVAVWALPGKPCAATNEAVKPIAARRTEVSV